MAWERTQCAATLCVHLDHCWYMYL
jgi:hypothetical protein